MTDVNIDKFGFSVRSINALHNAGIFNAKQLIQLSDKDLYNIPNMGDKSVAEVSEVILKIKNGKILISEDMISGKKIIIDETKDLEGITENDILVAWAHNKKITTIENVIFKKAEDIVEDLYIDEISFSNRSYNAMSKKRVIKIIINLSNDYEGIA